MKKIMLLIALLACVPTFAENNQNIESLGSMPCCLNERFWLFDKIATDFRHYINYREGLIKQARYEASVKPTDKAELLHHKQEYVKQRNFYRNELQGQLIACQYFFNASTGKLVDDFMAWDSQHIANSINSKSLPTKADYEAWQNKILHSLAEQLTN